MTTAQTQTTDGAPWRVPPEALHALLDLARP
jgi:hypothetical protein